MQRASQRWCMRREVQRCSMLIEGRRRVYCGCEDGLEVVEVRLGVFVKS
jgi:hypothetical protein